MLRAQRLRQRQEFANVYRRGRPYRSDLLIMRALRTNEPITRFGLTTSKAIGNAVTRNRVRRRMREAIGSIGFASGWDIVFNSRVRIAQASYAQVRETMRTLRERAELLAESAT